MKGRYHIIVQNKRVKFEFDIKRNITIIRGDSATGKTTLMNMVETYERLGEDSGISISCERACRTLNNANWREVIERSEDSIIFIDEETRVIKTTEFAEKIRDSSNYYVIITRENLPNLPYSVEEIYGIHNSGRYADIRQTYNSFYRLYGSEQVSRNARPDLVIVEDTNSGYDFFSSIVDDRIQCKTAGGKSGIKSLVKANKGKRILVIADGAAFGSEMEELYLYVQDHPEVSIYLPESFEWIILSSGLIDGNRILDIVQNTENYVESSRFFSWEQYYTRLLVDETQDSYLKYSKSRLNKAYLHDKERAKMMDVIKVVTEMLQT